MKVTKKVRREVEIEQTVRESDFSGREIPAMHWSAVTNIWCVTSDHGTKNGNQGTVFDLELMPEEMAAFTKDLQALIASHQARWRQHCRQ